MEIATIVYLSFMFIAIYFFSFFIILTIRNRDTLFSYPKPKKIYDISVLIPAFNEENSIEETINHVCSLDYPEEKIEIVIINDGSTDRTKKIVERMQHKYKNLKLFNKENSGKADSLNLGISKTKGELIAVVDSDSFPERESLKKLTGYFNDEKMGAVTSFVKIRNKEDNFFAKIQAIEYLILGWSRKLLDYVDSVNVTNGPLSLYRKKYISKVGGFDRNTVTEDIDITWNLLYHGYKTGMCLDANVSTIAPIKFKRWFRQRTRWGLGGLQAIAKYKKMFLRKGMFGLFILPYVSLSVVLSIFTFLFSLYLFGKFMLVSFLAADYSVIANTKIFSLQDINLYPSVIIFYFVILFTLSISYSIYILNKLKFEKKLTMERFFNILFYVFVYLTSYPIIWFFSIYRFIKKDNRW